MSSEVALHSSVTAASPVFLGNYTQNVDVEGVPTSGPGVEWFRIRSADMKTSIYMGVYLYVYKYALSSIQICYCTSEYDLELV